MAHACNPSYSGDRETESRRIEVQSQPRQIVHETLSRKTSSQKRAVGVTQGVSPKFKTQYHKKNFKKNDISSKFPKYPLSG
jgi:hypothetical protein